jgi:hypothetical protein
MNKFTMNYFVGGTNVLAANQPIPILTPHHNLQFHMMIGCNGNRTNQHQACDQRLLPAPRSNTSSCGSLWSESQALLSFRYQLRQFDCGTCPISPDCDGSKNGSILDESAIQPTLQRLRHHSSARASRWSESDAMIRFRTQSRHFDRGSQSFLARHQPSTQELIAMTTRKSRCAQQKRKDTSIAITAHQLAHAKNIALRQVTSTSTEVWKNEKYGHAP